MSYQDEYQRQLGVIDLIIRAMQLHEKAIDRVLERLEELSILQDHNVTKFADLIDELKETIKEVKK